jgi:hypothetical protein
MEAHLDIYIFNSKHYQRYNQKLTTRNEEKENFDERKLHNPTSILGEKV